MNLNYAIFRSEPINTLGDLAQIGSHNKREKQSYKSNPNIDKSKSNENIELVPLTSKYVKGFYNLTKEYQKQHEEKMKTERNDRQKSYREMLDKSKSVVADELLFTATNTFFKNMNKDNIKDWADTCMKFVYKDLGYTREQVLHATIHLDEKTPHIHCVVVPLIKKFDKRVNKEKWTISKKQYIKDKVHLSELQDKYHQRLVSKGYDLERGIKGSDTKHINVKDFKKITKKLEQKLDIRNDKLDKAINEFNEKTKSNKSIPFDKKHVILEKNTLDSMNKVVNETKKIMELQPKIEKAFNEINNYTDSYNYLNNQNKEYIKEINYLKSQEEKLKKENKKLKDYIKAFFESIKTFFRQLLIVGNEKVKEATASEIKGYYDNQKFNSKDVYNISKKTTKEDELFNYADIPDYYKTNKKNHREKDDFSISL